MICIKWLEPVSYSFWVLFWWASWVASLLIWNPRFRIFSWGQSFDTVSINTLLHKPPQMFRPPDYRARKQYCDLAQRIQWNRGRNAIFSIILGCKILIWHRCFLSYVINAESLLYRMKEKTSPWWVGFSVLVPAYYLS